MRERVGIWIVCSILYGLPASAKRPDVKPSVSPSLDEILTSAGWTMTPERSSTYSAGDVYSRASNSPVMFNADCFAVTPREGLYTSLEVIQAMKAGARVPLGIARVRAGGMEYKQRRFAEPFVSEIASLQLNPSQSCRDTLARFDDPADLFVITSVLSAEVKEQLCRSIEGGASVAGFKVGGEMQQECAQESEGHVVVAYKTRSWPDVLQHAPLPVHEVAAGIAVRTATAAADFQETSQLDIDDKLRLQECKNHAQLEGERIRLAKLEGAKSEAQRKASMAWEALRPKIEQCVGLATDLKGECIRAVESWVAQASVLQVALEQGEELVETECGPLAAAFEYVQETFEASELVEAEDLLRRLRIESTPVGQTGLFRLSVSAPPMVFDTLHVLCQVGGFVKGSAEGVTLSQAGEGPCRVDAFGGTGQQSATLVVSQGGHYRCSNEDGPLTCTLTEP